MFIFGLTKSLTSALRNKLFLASKKIKNESKERQMRFLFSFPNLILIIFYISLFNILFNFLNSITSKN